MNLNQDIKSYEKVEKSLALLKMIIKSERQIHEVKITKQIDVFDRIEEKYFK